MCCAAHLLLSTEIEAAAFPMNVIDCLAASAAAFEFRVPALAYSRISMSGGMASSTHVWVFAKLLSWSLAVFGRHSIIDGSSLGHLVNGNSGGGIFHLNALYFVFGTGLERLLCSNVAMASEIFLSSVDWLFSTLGCQNTVSS